MKDVFAIYESRHAGERSRWVRIGVAFDNKDGSINVLLDAVPLSGRLQVRPRDGSPGATSADPGATFEPAKGSAAR
jgi:hypothetical protein